MRARAGLAAAAALLIAAAAIAQDQAPESLLPPGFGDPVPPAAAPTDAPPAPSAASVGPTLALPPLAAASPTPAPSASPSPIDPALLAEYEMPAFARRSLAEVGALGSAEGGLPLDAFGDADGGYVEGMMRRIAAPVPSRWLSITLRRALLSRVATPRGLNGADFAAERAWLLLRMGESASARAITQAIDTDRTTPKLRQVAMQAALATGDPGGLCPLVPAELGTAPARGWIMAQAMCAGLAGPPGEARRLIAAARRRGIASGIDLQLAQKVIGAGVDSRQAITIEWEPVDRLTTWRFGLATAIGVAVPEPLYATVGPQVTGWRALAPAIPLADRAAVAERAAAMGVLSSAALVDLHAALAAAEDAPAGTGAVARDLQDAYAGPDRATRDTALRTLWSGAPAGTDPYGRLVLTAYAAARVPPRRDFEGSDRLVAAMLSAGMDRSAQRWRTMVTEGGDAWAMLALADPDAAGRLPYGVVSGYSGAGDAERKRRLFFAGLAGLGRLSPEDIERGASALDVRIGMQNRWTQAIDRAAAERQAGTVVLLAALGMQTPVWRGVPPEALYRIVGALRAVGLGGEARMIAAEAIARG